MNIFGKRSAGDGGGQQWPQLDKALPDATAERI